MTEICELRKVILSAFYNILQRNFGILLILWCSFKLWWNFVSIKIYARILKAHSHSMSGGSIGAFLESHFCFWTDGELVPYRTMWLLTLQLLKNSIDTQGKLRLNLRSLRVIVSERLGYERKSITQVVNWARNSKGLIIFSGSCIPINPKLHCHWHYQHWNRPFKIIMFNSSRNGNCGRHKVALTQ
jgi:hypothetical protein